MSKHFYKLDFEKEPSEQTEAELRATLEDFKERHETNLAAYEALREELDEIKAGLAAELQHSLPLTEDELMEFSLDRLRELATSPVPQVEEKQNSSEGDDKSTPAFTREDKPSKTGRIDPNADANLRGQDIIKDMPGLKL